MLCVRACVRPLDQRGGRRKKEKEGERRRKIAPDAIYLTSPLPYNLLCTHPTPLLPPHHRKKMIGRFRSDDANYRDAKLTMSGCVVASLFEMLQIHFWALGYVAHARCTGVTHARRCGTDSRICSACTVELRILLLFNQIYFSTPPPPLKIIIKNGTCTEC